MNTTDLAQPGKHSTAGNDTTGGHPAGEIRLRSGGGLGRRSQLLGGASAFRNTSPWTTVSIELYHGDR